VVVAAITAIFNAGDQSLTHGRGVISKEEGFILTAIDESLTEAEQAALFVETRPAVAKDSLIADVEGLYEDLEGALEFILPQSLGLPELLEKLAGLLINPTYDPAKACLAPAPLLRDLLDLALGKITGGIDAIVGKVAQTAWDFLLPAGIEGDDLGRFVESVLADPVTAALNWILGKKAQIDCVVTGGLAVGEGVLETQVRRLEEALAEAIP
jgi:hypothetical protein